MRGSISAQAVCQTKITRSHFGHLQVGHLACLRNANLQYAYSLVPQSLKLLLIFNLYILIQTSRAQFGSSAKLMCQICV